MVAQRIPRLGFRKWVVPAFLLGALWLWTVTPAAIAGAVTPAPPSPARVQTGEADPWLGKADERAALFDTYLETIKSGHRFSDLGMQRLGLNWEQEIARARQRFTNADTKNDVYYALLGLQRLLHDAHSGLTVPPELIPPSPNVALPFTLAVRGDSLANARYVVATSSLPKVKPGMILRAYQGRSLAELESEYVAWLDSSSPEMLKIQMARDLTRIPSAQRMPQPDISLPVVATFVDPGTQTEVQITAQWGRTSPEVAPNDYAPLAVDYRGIHYHAYVDAANDTLYVVYTSFNYALSDADLKQALTKAAFTVPPFDPAQPLAAQPEWVIGFLQANGHPDAERVRRQGLQSYSFTGMGESLDYLTLAKYLNRQNVANVLVDVRDNSGGNVNFDLLRLFASRPFTGTQRAMLYLPLTRNDDGFLKDALTQADWRTKPIILDQLARDKEATQSRAFPWNCKTDCCAPQEGVFNPNAETKKFHFAVLSGPRCASGCEHFVATTKDNGLGQVVGLPSRGASAPFRAAKSFALKNGQTFSMILNTGVAYRANGELLEGNPAPVDYYLFPEDGYLSKLVRHLQQQGFFKTR